MVPRQIRGDGEQPVGKFLSGAKTLTGLENADESFLREIIRIVLVLHHAAEEMKNRRGVALHQIIERGIVTGLQLFHVRPVKVVGVSR
jgi:hypothetical protein